MKAFVQHGSSASFADAPVPRPGPRQVLVRVAAAALNRADLALLEGQRHGGTGGSGTVLGLEWAGTVEALGPDVRACRVGERVMCTGIGGFAQYAVADERRVLPLPTPATSFEEAACLPVALTTMHDAVVTHGGLRPGHTVLVQGASTAVGLMAMQIARLLGAALVIGTSTHAGRRARLVDHGADLVLDSSDPQWPEQVLAATQGRGVDLLVDQLSGPAMNGNLRATAIGGRIVNVGRLAGGAGAFDFELHALRRLTYVGVTFRTRSIEEIETIFHLARQDLWHGLQQHRLVLPIHATYALEDAAQAHAALRRNEHLGKLVLVA